MTLNPDQFDDWNDYDKSREIRVPRSRFYGLSQQASDYGISHIDRLEQPDVIGEGVDYALGWSEEQDVPISGLLAQHHIDRNNAKRVFNSIRSRGYDSDKPITVIRMGGGGDLIYNGHHRSVAARAAGMRSVPAIVVQDEDVDRGIGRYLDSQKHGFRTVPGQPKITY